MTSRALLVFAFCWSLPVLAQAPQADPEAANLDPEVLKALDQAMKKQVNNAQVSGVIGIIGRHGKIGYANAFGRRVIERDAPMKPDTLFRIYSMTKPIVAVTAMALWEEGKFKLDDPISTHLPEWKNATVREGGKAVPAKSPVTPRHLMTHSSGLSYGRTGLNLDPGATLEEFSRSAARQPLRFHPGTDYVYGYSIDILGRYVEAIEGKSLDVVMRERVFDRIGMKDSEYWVRNPADRDRVAFVYRRERPGKLVPLMRAEGVMTKPARMMGGQGLVSTAGDYARFCQMLLNRGELDGKRVLKAGTVEIMFRNHLKDIGKSYGLGGRVDEMGGYSWGGAAGTRFWIDSKNDAYVVFMIQARGYKAPTFDVFKPLAAKAIRPEKN